MGRGLIVLLVSLAPALASAAPDGGAIPVLPGFPALAPDQTPRARLSADLDQQALARLRERARVVAAIATPAALEARKQTLRTQILALMGGLPTARTPLHARVVGKITRPGFTVEKVIYQSQPGFYVTANLYVPAGGHGPFPAVLASVGHGDFGKAGERQGPDLARRGFVVLMPDPIGQGERLQHFDPQLGLSRAGGPVEEHGQAAARAELVGDSLARYLVWDAMRGLDYLASRSEVDGQRLGATGCSGGGTVTTYLAALDDRVKVAGVACFITSWTALLAGPGPQEAEQSLHGFLSAGLDMGDYLALIAPRPLQIVSTTDDFFPLAGARAEVEEAKRAYHLQGADDHLSWTVGPGGHGNPREGREAITAFFLRWLGPGGGDASEQADARLDPEDLDCTTTGQLATSLGGKTLADLVATRAAELAPVRALPADDVGRAEHAQAMIEAVKRVAGVAVTPGGPPPTLAIARTMQRPGYRLDIVTLTAGSASPVWGLLAIPPGHDRRAATLIVDPRLRNSGAEPGGELDQRAQAGEVVLAIEPRGTPTAAELPAKPSLLGISAALYRRASVVGRNLVGIQAEDIIHAADFLALRPEVDGTRISAFGVGGAAVALLHAAVIDVRLQRLALQEMLPSYRAVLEHPIHRNLPDSLIPGVLRAYDLPELLLAVAPRTVALVNPVGPAGDTPRRATLARWLAPLRAADGKSGHPDRVRVIRRGRRDPLRWE